MRVLSIYFIILAFLSLNPWLHPDPGLAIGNVTWDKIDHAAAYCLLSLLFMSAYWSHHKHQWAISFMVLLACPLVGILIEYCQLWFTSKREFSYYDALANVFGAVSGVALFWCLFVCCRKIRPINRLNISDSREDKH